MKLKLYATIQKSKQNLEITKINNNENLKEMLFYNDFNCVKHIFSEIMNILPPVYI